jgi:folate-binding protein YgfZ
MFSDKNLSFIPKSLSGRLAGAPTAWVGVTGPDAATFLQGQCTQDLRGLRPGDTAFALWLTLKGKVMGESLVLKEDGDAWWLWSAHTPGAALSARLEEFVIADDVTIAVGGAEWTQLTLAGDAGEAWLRVAREGREPPSTGRAEAWAGGWLFAGRRGQARVWDWVRPAASADPAPAGESATGETGALTEAALRLDRLAAGVPAIPAEFGPGDLPQEAGLEAVAISFTKGCYLGQEVMARLQAMGQVRRKLVRVAGAGPAPTPGGELRQAGKRVGELRAAADVAADADAGWLGLAMINLLGLDPSAEIGLADGGAVALIDRP